MEAHSNYLKIRLVGVLSLLFFQSCQTLGIRKPSAFYNLELIDSKKLEEVYALNVKLDSLLEKRKKSEIKEVESKLKKLNEEIQILAEDLKLSSPVSQWNDYKKDWRFQKEKMVIEDPAHYALDDGKIRRTFTMDLSGTTDYQLGIVNKAWTPGYTDENPDDESMDDNRRYFEATIKCDNDFKIKSSLFTKSISQNKVHKFRIYEQDNNSPKNLLYLNQKIKYCEIYFNNPENPEMAYGVRLVNDEFADQQISKFKDRFETCVLPDISDLKGVEKLFLTANFKSMTCPSEITDIKSLEEPIDGLKAKAETLLGQDLSDDFLKSMNPNGELDFSRAPKLNIILISYLVFRHDFYGTLIARLCKWHADHGTQVRILMSDVISDKKDRLMLHNLAETSNNIKVQEYRYDSNGGGLWDHLSEFHRTMHVKLFVTLSDNPLNNIVYLGGRNIHDGFVFMTNPDHSAFPELVQYGSGKGKDENYAPWRDYELRIRSQNLAEQIASSYLTLWQRDSQSFYIRSINQNIVSKVKVDPKYFERNENSALIRNVLSVPYKDQEALEKLYVNIFDSAEKIIRLSTPYFRPTKKIGEAIQRAVSRGVDISLITRIDLSGDTADIILSEVNKEGINRFLKKIKIFEYTEPGVILHSKIILIDQKLSIIGSVNLNKRSFVHDMENTAMIYNPAYNKKMNEVLDGYQKQTKEVTEKQKIALWKRIVIGIFDTEL